jgi:regulator of nucleoside diphosphate kinase
MRNRIYITKKDMERLRRLVDGLQAAARADAGNLAALEEELDRAHVVDAARIRPDVITLNSHVRIMDLDSKAIFEYEVVYPNTRPRSSVDGLSVLAPLGTALLGYRAGDTIEWSVPKGKRRLKVLEVLFQPEAASTSAA